MHVDDLVHSAYDSLLRTRGRSILTMLGIVIGITAVILALSIGESAKLFILAQISSFGSDQLMVDNGPRADKTGELSLYTKETLAMKDYKRLKKEPWVKAVVGQVFQTDLLKVEGQARNVTVIGTMPDDIIMNGYKVKEGVFFTDDEVGSHSRTAVLGYTIADKYFGLGNAVGKNIKLGTQSYKVVGVLDKLGTKFFQNLDEMVYLPVTTVMDKYKKEHFTFMSIQSSIPLSEAQPLVEIIFRESHNLNNPEGDYAKDDFHVVSQEEAIKIVSQITGVLEVLLAAIAAISLLVGGIGIMNIMFVSVTERIKEIGLRKALGARREDILNQFLAEAIILTVAGGAVGIAFGTFLAWLAIQIILSYQSGWQFTISLNGVLLGFIVSTLVGLVFGYVPARRAAKLHPIDAMRAND
ncbi:MAG: ABC transporter permease [Patescibacteria group bacterium]|nr:ABC transporter permease [Patescibacteria group bacterium]